MKTLFALLLAAAACGVEQKSADQKAAVAECSYALPADSTELEVQSALADIEAGRLDPCAGALRSTAFRAELEGIDRDAAGRYLLRLRIFQQRTYEF